VSRIAIQPDEFVAAVTPLLERQDPCGLLQLLKSRWTADQIVDLLKSRHCDARKVAALALGLAGGKCCVAPLSERLKDPDPVVNEMAEHALWSIWFRSGSCQANHALQRGAMAMEAQDLDAAITHFTKAIEIDPNFAEAYNQRAIARYLAEQWDESIADCQRTVELMPCHFGAWAGMGHCHTHEGRFAEALRCYRKALEINPHLGCLTEACEELGKECGDDNAGGAAGAGDRNGKDNS
jgi:Tfp pilus assembly protein PilF